MGRPKKNSSDMLVALVDEFYLDGANGDISRLNCTEIGRYAGEKGMSVKAYDLRRDEKVRMRIRQLKEENRDKDNSRIAASYKTLDVEGLIRNCRSADELVEKIMELDKYWKSIYMSISRKEEQLGRALEEKEKSAERERESVLNTGSMLEVQRELATENRKLLKENAILRRMLEHYLYPAVAEHILKEEGLSITPREGINPDRLLEFVDGRKPEPLKKADPVAYTQGGIKSQKLMEQMRRAAFKDGNKQTETGSE